MQIAVYDEAQFNYLVYFPKCYDETKKYPLMLFLHGMGERGNELSILKRTGIPKIFDCDVDYEVIVVSPQCPENLTWNSRPEKLFRFLQWIIKKYNADEDAVSITGLSMGGFGTWQLIADYPQIFSAAAPICGGRASVLERAASVPIRIYHGEKDDVVSVMYSKDAYEILKRHNAKDVELFIYPECYHDSWTKAYEQTDLIDWLISKRK